MTVEKEAEIVVVIVIIVVVIVNGQSTVQLLLRTYSYFTGYVALIPN